MMIRNPSRVSPENLKNCLLGLKHEIREWENSKIRVLYINKDKGTKTSKSFSNIEKQRMLHN